MKETYFQLMRRRLLTRVNGSKAESKRIYETLKLSEWSEAFETFMRNRLIMGALRYGKLRSPEKPEWDRIPLIRRQLNLYEKTGNKEHLVDIANLCLVEFVECNHTNEHLSSSDDGEHVTIKTT